MKEFEKWWNEERSDEEFLTETANITTQEQALDVLAKLSWKAALEWVLTKVEVSNSDGSIIQYIKDELLSNQTNNNAD